jgi:VanZ family protein
VALSRRHKLVLAALLLYWPGIFVATHVPQMPRWVGQIAGSDKVLHFVAYLLLSFLFWFAVNPDNKVNWRKPAVWWILLAVVWYGVIDEWLQMYVGRDTDVRDFQADLAGAITGLAILTVANFWPASLVIAGGGIFALTNVTRAHPVTTGPRMDLVLCVCGYAFLTLLWLRYMHHFLPAKPPQARWLLGAVAFPFGLMAAFEVFCAVTGEGLSPVWVLLSSGAILVAVVPFFIYGLFKRSTVTPAPY